MNSFAAEDDMIWEIGLTYAEGQSNGIISRKIL